MSHFVLLNLLENKQKSKKDATWNCSVLNNSLETFLSCGRSHSSIPPMDFTFNHFSPEVEACSHRKTNPWSPRLKSQPRSSAGQEQLKFPSHDTWHWTWLCATTPELKHCSYCHLRESNRSRTAEEGNTQGRTLNYTSPWLLKILLMKYIRN